MSLPEFFLRLVLITAAIVGVLWLLIALVRRTQKGQHATRAFGAALAILGWGFRRDPRNDTVAEAQDGRIRKGESTGDPPAPPDPRQG